MAMGSGRRIKDILETGKCGNIGIVSFGCSLQNHWNAETLVEDKVMSAIKQQQQHTVHPLTTIPTKLIQKVTLDFGPSPSLLTQKKKKHTIIKSKEKVW